MHTNSSEKNEDKQLFIKKQVKNFLRYYPPNAFLECKE